MKRRSAIRFLCAVSVLAPFLAQSTRSQTAGVTCFPVNAAVGINPDTHLVLTFSAPPTLGKSGQIRIYDAADHQLVDTLDLSIPAGPDPSRRVTTAARAAARMAVPLPPPPQPPERNPPTFTTISSPRSAAWPISTFIPSLSTAMSRPSTPTAMSCTISTNTSCRSTRAS